MAGFENQVLVAKNVNFDHLSSPPHNGIVTANGQLLIGSTTDPNNQIVANTLTPGTGITITNGPGSITIATTASLTDLHVAKWIVNPVANAGGNSSTIQNAINQAVSGETIFVMPGTYTENLTLKPGVNITAFNGDQQTPTVTIVGNATLSQAGTVSISNIRLQTNSAAVLTVSGSVASIVNLNNCYLNCTNNTGITFSSSSASAAININFCMGNITTTGIALFAHSSAGSMQLFNSIFFNSGSSTTASTQSDGSLLIRQSIISNPITTSGSSAGLQVSSSTLISNNVITLNLNSTSAGGHVVNFSGLSSGTAASISIGAGATAILANLFINSSNATSVITGAGSVSFSGLTFGNTGRIVDTTTQTQAGTLQGSKTVAPTAGMIGEEIRSAVAKASAIALTTATAANVTSISLTRGVWSITGLVSFTATGGAVTGTSIEASLNTTSATRGTGGDNASPSPTIPVFNTADIGVTVANWVQTFTSTTTVYLIAFAGFTVNGISAYGRISAERIG